MITRSRFNRRTLLASVQIILSCGSTCLIRADMPDRDAQAAIGGQRPIVVQNYYYARPGKAEETYQWRLHASEVRVRLGLPRGRILRRVLVGDSIPSPDLPDVIWECEYSSVEARNADIARLDRSPEFADVERHMDTLIRNFRRAIFEVDR